MIVTCLLSRLTGYIIVHQKSSSSFLSQDTSRVTTLTTGRRAHCIHHAPSLRNFSFSIEINLMCDSSISHPFPLSFLCAALAHAASPDALRCVPVHSLQKYFIKIFYRMLRDPGPDQSFSYNTSVTRLSSLLFISAIYISAEINNQDSVSSIYIWEIFDMSVFLLMFFLCGGDTLCRQVSSEATAEKPSY